MWPLVYASRAQTAYALLPFHINYTTIVSDTRTRAHRHRVFHLVFFVEGEAILEHTRGTFPVRERDIVMIDPGEKHVFVTRGRDVVYFTFNFYLFPVALVEGQGERFGDRIRDAAFREAHGETRPFADLFGTPQNDVFFRYDPANWDDIRIAIDALNASRLEYFIDPDAPTYQQDVLRHGADIVAFLHRFLRFIMYRQPADRAPGDELGARIVAYLKHHVDKKYSLKALAAHLNYTPNYLCGYFKKTTGMSIARYCNRLRIERACNYLRATNLSVTEVAYRMDFSSSQHFSRNFRQEKKMSPSEYRLRVAH